MALARLPERSLGPRGFERAMRTVSSMGVDLRTGHGTSLNQFMPGKRLQSFWNIHRNDKEMLFGSRSMLINMVEGG